jgi:hypothetical protein
LLDDDPRSGNTVTGTVYANCWIKGEKIETLDSEVFIGARYMLWLVSPLKIGIGKVFHQWLPVRVQMVDTSPPGSVIFVPTKFPPRDAS